MDRDVLESASSFGQTAVRVSTHELGIHLRSSLTKNSRVTPIKKS